MAAPTAELVDLGALPILYRNGLRIAGAVLAVLGIGTAMGAQRAMGASWRDDVEPAARTVLVTR
ncbi:hypothetical protein ACPCAE_04170 [Streptomyces cinereoruber]|uniref:hypothetical protein n=1 Tax=Streptomyces cinereoruber TaxID=67260 RepID=UPI003C2DE777